MLFVAWPLCYSLYISFCSVKPAGFSTRFIGFRNYARAFLIDVEFLPMLAGTIWNVVIDTPIILFFSLSVAILLNRNLAGQGIFRVIFFLPVVIGTGVVIQELLGQGVGGLAVALGVEGGVGTGASIGMAQAGEVAAQVTNAQTPNIVNVSRIIFEFLGPNISKGVNDFLNRLGLTLWRSGIQILLFLAGLQGISSSLYESARIDGASEWTLFWKVTIPMISPVVLAVIIFTIVDTFVDIFNPVLQYVRTVGFQQFKFGYSAALSWLYFISVFILILIVMLTYGRRVFYRGEK